MFVTKGESLAEALGRLTKAGEPSEGLETVSDSKILSLLGKPGVLRGGSVWIEPGVLLPSVLERLDGNAKGSSRPWSCRNPSGGGGSRL